MVGLGGDGKFQRIFWVGDFLVFILKQQNIRGKMMVYVFFRKKLDDFFVAKKNLSEKKRNTN